MKLIHRNIFKGGNYKLFKGELKFENYLDILEDKDKFTLCRFRTTNHRLPVEVGRWKKIIRENRFCHLCSRRELGDCTIKTIYIRNKYM
jgi:hypothetical protein